MFKSISKIFKLLVIFSLLLMLAAPAYAQDDIPAMSEGDVLLATAVIVSLLVGGLLGGGTGYVIRAIRAARDERFMTLLENQYNGSNDALKQTVSTLESVSRFLAVSIPMTTDMRRGFLEVASLVGEVTDGVPAVSKNSPADSPSNPVGEILAGG